MKDAYYFSHDSNATGDPRMMQLLDSLGLEGYGCYWVLIEHLREQPDFTSSTAVLRSLAKRTMAVHNDMSRVIECFEHVLHDYDLFVIEEDTFYSRSLMRRMEEVQARRERYRSAGRKGGVAKASLKQRSGDAKASLQQRSGDALAMSSSKGKESKGKESKENTSGSEAADALEGQARQVLDHLNTATGRQFKYSDTSLKHIRARLRDGVSVENCIAVIDNRVEKWYSDSRMSEYLRPSTLFTPEHFEEYLQAANAARAPMAAAAPLCPKCGGKLIGASCYACGYTEEVLVDVN